MSRISQVVKFSICAALVATTLACSNKNKVKDIETEMDVKGGLQGSEIGVDKNKEMVIQTQTSADIELRDLRWRTYELEQKLTSQHELLSRCRTEIADPRLGGSGTVTDLPEIDAIKPPSQIKEELGITEKGSLKVVKKEYLVERLEVERTFETNLKKQLDLVNKSQAKCEREMGYARVKAGLPAKRYPAIGKYEGGRYVLERRAEQNLDDAFEFLGKNSATE